MSKKQSVPLVVLLGLSSPFCLTEFSDDAEPRPVYRTLARSVVEPEVIVCQDVYTGDLIQVSQYDHVFPPAPAKVAQ